MTALSLLIDRWSADGAILVPSALAIAVFLRGAQRAASARQAMPSHARWRFIALLASLGALVLASCSPIDAYSSELFWVHMIQHLLVLAVFAPLLVLAAPWLAFFSLLPQGLQQGLAGAGRRASRLWVFRSVAGPLILSFIVSTFGLWIWHWPPLYDAALQNEIIHDYGEHLTFMVVGVLFWLQVIPSPPFHPVAGFLGRTFYLLAAVFQNVILSMVLGFAQSPLYAPYAALTSRPGGLSALTDQQFGAAIMWSVGDLPFVIAVTVLAQRWLREMLVDPGVSEAPPAPHGA